MLIFKINQDCHRQCKWIYGCSRLHELTGIAAGAEVNVQSDWNATSGDSFIQNKPTIPNTEAIQDIVGAMVTGGTETGINVTYDDPNGRLNFVVTASGGGTPLPTEHARLSLNHTEREVGSATVTVTGTLSVNSPFTFVGTGAGAGNSGKRDIICCRR